MSSPQSETMETDRRSPPVTPSLTLANAGAAHALRLICKVSCRQAEDTVQHWSPYHPFPGSNLTKGIKVAKQQGAIVPSCECRNHTREAFIYLFKCCFADFNCRQKPRAETWSSQHIQRRTVLKGRCLLFKPRTRKCAQDGSPFSVP